LTASILVVLAGYAVFHRIESPSAVLKHALHIRSIPSSIAELRMGSDVWTDEVRCFSFAIAPGDFDRLLMGRAFAKITFEYPREALTMHLSPAVSVSGHASYQWRTNGADCTIFPDDAHEHIIVIFTAD